MCLNLLTAKDLSKYNCQTCVKGKEKEKLRERHRVAATGTISRSLALHSGSLGTAKTTVISS